MNPFTLVEILQKRALNHPARCAYIFLEGEEAAKEITFGELDIEARRIAATLQARECLAERTLLLYPSGLEYITAFLGCLYAGAIAVPVYPPKMNRPDHRLESIIADAQPKFALTSARILAEIQSQSSEMLALRSLSWLATDLGSLASADDWSDAGVKNDSIALLQYTSGSTSSPKGVMVSHDNLIFNERMIQTAFEQTEKTTVVGWLPLYHDMGLIGNVLQPLYNGAQSVLMSPMRFLQQPFLWLDAISRYAGHTSGGPDFAYRLCAQKVTRDQREKLDLSSWRIAFVGAEPIREETLDLFSSTFESCGFKKESFYPCYGLAEATLFVSGGSNTFRPVVDRITQDSHTNNEASGVGYEYHYTRSVVGCGRTWMSQKILIVDPQSLTRCKAGCIGEIWVSGPNVTKGYWNRVNETQRSFNAFLSDSREGPFLRTGDLGYLKDGELFVTGRLKDLIIIRGSNYYPQDIEFAVEQSHRLLRPNSGAAFSVDLESEERLVVVQELERHYKRDELIEVVSAIRRAVMEHFGVQVFAVVLLRTGSIPKTTSGKIQRHACRAAFLAGTLKVEYRSVLDYPVHGLHENLLSITAILALEPGNRKQALEDYVRSEAADVLGINPSELVANTPLTHMGLDSLKSVELKNRLEYAIGISISVVTMLEGISVTQLTDIVFDQLMVSVESPKGINHRTASEVGEHFLSPGQKALWFLQQLDPVGSTYNIFLAVAIPSALNIPALKHAFEKLVRRYAALRTNFHLVKGEPIQLVHNIQNFDLEEINALDWNEEEITQSLASHARAPFDLAKGPLFRVALLYKASHEYILMIAVHHIVADLWSMMVLLNDLSVLYSAEVIGKEAIMPSMGWQHIDYVRWLNELLAGQEGERLWSYWEKQLSGKLPVIKLPTDRSRPRLQKYTGASYSFTLSGKLTQQLKSLCISENATLYVTLLAAFEVLLYCYSGQEDILIGSPMAGRTRAELARTFGYLMNPVVLRANLSGNPTFSSFLAGVRRTVLGALEHQNFPFVWLVERMGVERLSDASPIFQVVFNFQNSPFAAPELSGVKLNLLDVDIGTTKHDLTLYIREDSNKLSGSFAYNVELFNLSTIRGMAENFEIILGAIVRDVGIRLYAIREMINQTERKYEIMADQEQEAAKPKKFVTVERKAIRPADQMLIATNYLNAGETLPLVVRPNLSNVELIEWAKNNLSFIEVELLRHGAILFRDFILNSASVFEQFALTIASQLVNYVEGSSPRVMLADKVYTSTEYPPEYFISLHNELSYAHQWPSKIFFYCAKAPESGGETPIASSRRVFERLDPKIKERFIEKGVKYVRNLHGERGAGLSWQAVFETSDRAVVEEYCRNGLIDFKWKENGGLWTSQVRPAVITHPKTGERVWFNQVDQWHPSNLSGEEYRALIASTNEEHLPINAYYGDGSPLEALVLDEIRRVYREAMVTFRWKEGDILLLDNMLVAHGRMPFTGPRKILVAMGETVSLSVLPRN